MAQSTILPNIFWKITNVSGYCKRKCPPFEFWGVKWRLKFIYTKTPQGDICRIDLKSSGNESSCKNICITSWCLLSGCRYFEKPIMFISSELKEMTVWQESWISISAFKSETNGYTDISSFWEKTVFVCSFTVTSWTPNAVPQSTDHEDSIPVDRSPCITSMCHDFGKLYNNHTMSDVTLISGGTKIYAHRNILSARSDVFAAMFRNDMKESRERTVDINDMDGTVLEILVRYMYSGKVQNLSSENVHKVYAAADKYGVVALKIKCAIFMVENPSENVSQSNLLSSESSTNDVKQTVLSHFANIKNVLCSDEWQKLSESEPEFAHEAFLFFVSRSPS